jgi:hypothetical protein
MMLVRTQAACFTVRHGMDQLQLSQTYGPFPVLLHSTDQLLLVRPRSWRVERCPVAR